MVTSMEQQLMEEAEREFFGHLLPRYLRRVYKAPPTMSLEAFKGLLAQRAQTERNLMARRDAWQEAETSNNNEQGAAQEGLEERIVAAKAAEKAKAKARLLAQHQQSLQAQQNQTGGAESKAKESAGKEKEEKGADKGRSTDKRASTEAEPLTFTKRRRISVDEERPPRRRSLDEERAAAARGGGEGEGEGRERGGEVEEGEELPFDEDDTTPSEFAGVDDAEHARLVEEVRAQLDKLAHRKHSLMLNLKRVLSSGKDGEMGEDAPPPPPPPPFSGAFTSSGRPTGFHGPPPVSPFSVASLSLSVGGSGAALASGLPPPPPLPSHMLHAAKQAAASAANFAAHHQSRSGVGPMGPLAGGRPGLLPTVGAPLGAPLPYAARGAPGGMMMAPMASPRGGADAGAGAGAAGASPGGVVRPSGFTSGFSPRIVPPPGGTPESPWMSKQPWSSRGSSGSERSGDGWR